MALSSAVHFCDKIHLLQAEPVALMKNVKTTLKTALSSGELETFFINYERLLDFNLKLMLYIKHELHFKAG